MIGQSQVTDPLMTALRGDRVGHAYLFSGPRGCGKTTSARILARCLNCAEGPTDTPCGVCPSCTELSRNGGGSLDVVEIDAASHNGVDDARDLRERATFAPSRDRYKIFILDEAHMVTPQGFNALLKLVEEPPAHVKFIFATTEPEKVLGTIRSRTHHYPFRLVAPAAMADYVEKLCAEEGVQVETGVVPLVVRAGGGSPRDTLSLLDQLIAGSAPAADGGIEVRYERAVALLGYTHAALLDEVVEALAANNPAAAFPAVDRVVQTGQDPRRFVDDLLERLRDLIVIAAVGDDAAAVLRGVPEDELQRMRAQARAYGPVRLSRTADIVSAALDDMSGATSPRLHLELMIARVLADAADPAAGVSVAPSAAPASAPAPAAVPAPTQVPDPPSAPAAAVASVAVNPVAEAAPAPVPVPVSEPAPVPEPAPVAEPAPAPVAAGPVTIERIVASWPTVLAHLEKINRNSWLLATGVEPLAFDADREVLTLGFHSAEDVGRFRGTVPGAGPSDHLREAIEATVGVRVKYLPAPLPARAPAPDVTPPASPAVADPAPAAGGTNSSSSPSAPTPSASAAARHEQPRSAAPHSAPRPPASPGASGTGPTVDTRSVSAPNGAPTVTGWEVAAIPTNDPTVATIDAVPAAGTSAGSNPSPATDSPVGGVAAVSAASPSPAATHNPATPSVPRTVSDGPADVEAMPAAGWYEPPHDGDLSEQEPPPYEDEPPYDPGLPPEPYPADPYPSAPPAQATPAEAPSAVNVPAPSAPVTPPTQPEPQRPTAAPHSYSSPTPVQRYGEAVVRQVLGATFVREEPYEPPARFS